MQKILVAVLRALVLALYVSRIYKIKTYVQRFLFERKNKKSEVPLRKDMFTLTADTFGMKWRADGWRELWDMFASAEAAQYKIENPPEHGFDCDEFAISHCARINKALAAGYKLFLKDAQVVRAEIGAVFWVDGLKPAAHHVCIVEVQTNLNETKYTYIDYDLWSRHTRSKEFCLENVYLAYRAGASSAHVASFIESENLSLLKVI